MLLEKMHATFRKGDANFFNDIIFTQLYILHNMLPLCRQTYSNFNLVTVLWSLSLFSDLQPVDELGHIMAHELGVGG